MGIRIRKNLGYGILLKDFPLDFTTYSDHSTIEQSWIEASTKYADEINTLVDKNVIDKYFDLQVFAENKDPKIYDLVHTDGYDFPHQGQAILFQPRPMFHSWTRRDDYIDYVDFNIDNGDAMETIIRFSDRPLYPYLDMMDGDSIETLKRVRGDYLNRGTLPAYVPPEIYFMIKELKLTDKPFELYKALRPMVQTYWS